MKKYHLIEDVIVTADGLSLRIDGKKSTFKLRAVSRKIFQASPSERTTYEISPSGYGIHWPLIDEDISIDGLLNIKHVPLHSNQRPSVLARR